MSCEAPTLVIHVPVQLPLVVVSSLQVSARHAAELLWVEQTLNLLHEMKFEKDETHCPSRNRGIAKPCK